MTDSPWDNFEVRAAFSSKDDFTATDLGSLPAQNQARHNQTLFILKLSIKSISFFLCYFIFFLSNLIHYLRLFFCVCACSFFCKRVPYSAEWFGTHYTLNSWCFCFYVSHVELQVCTTMLVCWLWLTVVVLVFCPFTLNTGDKAVRLDDFGIKKCLGSIFTT